MSEMDHASPETVRLGPEIGTDRGWRYALTIAWAGREPTEHEVSLSHHDYEHWCGGVEPPSRIAHRAVTIAARALGPTLPPRFDLAQIRRRVNRFDELMAGDE